MTTPKTLDVNIPRDAIQALSMALDSWHPPQGADGKTIRLTYQALHTLLDVFSEEEPDNAAPPESA